MTSETDAEFVADMEWLHSHDREAALPPEKLDRLFALARRGAGLALDRQYDVYAAAREEYHKKIAEQADEIERLRAALRDAVMSDTAYCAEIERINKALIEAPTVDIDVVVPDRDYSAMTPKDCYEAGLLDGVYQAREAIKAAARAALGDPHAD